ncbi:MAG: septum formation initiator family protein [Candidatus Margulisbacteria bacterium]|jgi:cell division protein FtsL|nr:septum formation initiator family protein [Candidatus Margulisiibacteriota bacterium]
MPDKTLAKIILTAITVSVLLAVLFLVRQIHVMNTNNQIVELEAEIRALNYEHEKLEIELARYTGLEYLDTQAVRLGMIRPRNVRFILKSRSEASQ